MEKLSASISLILRAVVILVGVGTVAFLLWEPAHEGVNTNATVSQIYFGDPFLAYVYAASILFFIALYNVWKLLGKNLDPVGSLRTIKYCAIGLMISVLGAEVWILLQHGEDDPAGGVAMGLFATVIFAILGTGATLFERQKKRGADSKK